MTTEDDVFDLSTLLPSERMKLQEVIGFLQANFGKARDLEGFRREAVERFAEAGWRVDVLTYQTSQDGAYTFDVVPRGRIDSKVFDMEQMRHEITHDVAGTGKGGVFREDGAVREPKKLIVVEGRRNKKES